MGLVRIEHGVIVDQLSILVKPPNNYYRRDFSDNIHGIYPEYTANAPTFDKIWHRIASYIEGQDVVAHKSAFDSSVLKTTLEYYQMPQPTYREHCTYKIYHKNLKDLCAEYNLPLNHHDALSDALACAKLFELHLKKCTRNYSD